VSPAKRGSLTGMLPAPAAAPPMPVRPALTSPAEIQTPEVQTPEAASSQPSRRRQARQSAAPTLHVPTESPSLPKYLRLERKELLMWPGQITKLSILARVLNKNRGGAGERITVNTLIRVATALLLSRSQELEGTTEEELRRSLGLPELQTSDLQSRPDQVASSRLRWFVSHGRHSPRFVSHGETFAPRGLSPWGYSGASSDDLRRRPICRRQSLWCRA
jgi:hypothetical protein